MESRMDLIRSVKEKLDVLGQAMKLLKKDVDQIHVKLSKNCFVEDELADRVSDTLRAAGGAYAECRQAYGALFGNHRMLPVKMELVREELLKEEIRVQEELKQEKAKLFLGLRADNAEIGVLLREKQEKLRAVLKGRQADGVGSENLRPYLDFMEALVSDSSKAIEYVLKLSPYFDAKLLGYALIDKALSGTGAEAAREKGAAQAEQPEAGTGEVAREETPASAGAPSDPEPAPPAVEEASEAEAAEESKEEPAEEARSEAARAALERLLQTGFQWLSEESCPSFGFTHSPKENKEFKTKKFRSAVWEQSPYVRAALRQLCNFGYCSVGILQALSDGNAEAAEYALRFLYDKGYARKYWIESCGTFYGCSPRLFCVMESQEAASGMGISRRKKGDGDLLEVRAVHAMPRLAYLRLREFLLRACEGKEEPLPARGKLKGSVLCESTQCMGPDFFILDYVHGQDRDVAYGCFWTDEDDFFEFSRRFVKQSEALEDARRVVVASTTKEQALCAYEALSTLAERDLAEMGNLYFYALFDGRFYAGREQTEISPEEIWKDAEAPQEAPVSQEPEHVSEAAAAKEAASVSEGASEVILPEPSLLEAASEGEAVSESVLAPEEGAAEDSGVMREAGAIAEEPPSCADIAEERMTKEGAAGSEETAEAQGGAAPSERAADDGLKKDFWDFSVRLPKTLDEAMEVVQKLLTIDKAYCAAAYLKACVLAREEWAPMYRRLAYAVNDPMELCNYQSDDVIMLFGSEQTPFTESLMAAATVHTFMFDIVDYGTQGLLQAVKHCGIVSGTEGFSDLLFDLLKFKPLRGIDAYADYRQQKRVEKEQEFKRIQQEARDAYQKYVENAGERKALNKCFIEAKKLIFSKDKDIPFYLDMARGSDRSCLTDMQEYLRENIVKDGAPIDSVNVSQDKINRIMDDAWSEAQKSGGSAKKTTPLMGSLRNNLHASMGKIAEILCRWAQCAEILPDESEDEGRLEYLKLRKRLLENTKSALEAIDRRRRTSRVLAEQAGLTVVAGVLRGLSERIEGTYPLEGNKYFYVDFLRSDHVMLNDDYLPELRRSFDDAAGLSVFARIRDHAQMEKLPTMDERIREAFTGGDDLRSARLLDDCLKEREGRSVIADEKYDYEGSVNSADREAAQLMLAFQGKLELLQSYGQIDDEEKKNKILQTVANWYEYAKKTENFGVFRRVKEHWEEKITEDALPRKAQLERELEGCVKGMKETPGLRNRTEKIRQMIDLQNYTVAEDMLARLRGGESDGMDTMRSLFERDYLKDFLDEYEICYERVSDGKKSIMRLLGQQYQDPRNKEGRSGALLVWNWISGGFNEAEKLRTFLETLGFAVARVAPLPAVQAGNKAIDNYAITLRRPPNGQKANYQHPISAFGSDAEIMGFRVACLFGRYDDDGLIEWFKEMGNAKHTIVFLDWALSLPTRRTLARKVGETIQGKVFGVVDRVMLMYLIKHYDTMHINQMFMALMMPFAYCQPYVWESSRVMPPEIFMGRKVELKEIESPEGVNIVYGGRQLGKSAMLKMARNDIDRNENGDRAILVDIKDLNYEKAARKISQTLTDEKFFDHDVDTTDWDELARAIKQRLQSASAPEIKYFLLLLDEADAFIESCEAVRFHPFDALKDVQGIGAGRFKFVVAGLRNVIRSKRDKTLSGNTVLPHLKSLTVRPFQMAEARELLEVPLFYLGLRFPRDSREREKLISLILASTNYFPGLIQFYCEKLIEAMTRGDYAGYNELTTPIYEISETHIKTVLADASFNDQIKQKFNITLRLGDDQYYYVIALIMAYLYYENENEDGYSKERVMGVAENLEIEIITKLPWERLASFLEELCELNILRKTAEDKYLFTRYTFFQMMGTREKVEDELVEFMGG